MTAAVSLCSPQPSLPGHYRRLREGATAVLNVPAGARGRENHQVESDPGDEAEPDVWYTLQQYTVRGNASSPPFFSSGSRRDLRCLRRKMVETTFEVQYVFLSGHLRRLVSFVPSGFIKGTCTVNVIKEGTCMYSRRRKPVWYSPFIGQTSSPAISGMRNRCVADDLHQLLFYALLLTPPAHGLSLAVYGLNATSQSCCCLVLTDAFVSPLLPPPTLLLPLPSKRSGAVKEEVGESATSEGAASSGGGRKGKSGGIGGGTAGMLFHDSTFDQELRGMGACKIGKVCRR